MNRFARSLLVVTFALLVTVSPSAAAAKKVGIDKRFGSSGWVTVPSISGKRSLSPELTCVAGAGGRSLVAARYQTNYDNSKPVISTLTSLDARGNRVRRFGRNGSLRFDANNTPTDIAAVPGGKWLVTFSNRSRRSWKLVRLLANGRRDPKFGSNGVLKVPGNTNGANFSLLAKGGLVTYVPSATVFDSNGQRLLKVNGTGSLSVPFAVESVFETSDGKLLVGGRNGGQIFVTMLEADGKQSTQWNGGQPLAILPPPDATWKPALLRSSSDLEDFTARRPWISFGREVPGAIEMLYNFEAASLPKDSYDQDVTMRFRLLASGQLDLRLRGTGWELLRADFMDDALGAGDDEVIQESFHLPDGREVKAEFIYGSEQDSGSWSTFRVSDDRGRWSTFGARRITVNKLRFDHYDFDDRGKNLIVCGEWNFTKPVVGRVRL